MTLDTDRTGESRLDIGAKLSGYSLMDALLWRRSRRFAPGMQISGGPLAYRSTAAPRPLTRDEEAALAFAACGITGHTLAEMPYRDGDRPGAGGGNIIAQLVGRTIASGDGIHSVSLFVINDEGVSLVRRPQDLDRAEISDLIRLAHDRELSALYERVRVQVRDRRSDVPREVPFVPPFNQFSANVPGTTYFLPVAELTALMINLLLSAFEDDFAFYALDERNRFQPAGLAKFARSRGGHLNDDLSSGRVVTAGFLDTWLCEFAAIEQGAMLQNLGLMTQALGLGGFPHFAAHPFAWYQELGFRMNDLRFSRTIGAGPLMASVMSLTGRNMPMPTAVGFEHDGEPLLRPYCPPYYRNMEEAVLAFVDFKYAPGRGTLRDGGASSSWNDGAAVQSDIPKASDRAIAATIAYLDYLHTRYGRVPANNGPFRSVLAYQAADLDEDFYNRFYVPDALSPTQRDRAAQ